MTENYEMYQVKSLAILKCYLPVIHQKLSFQLNSTQHSCFTTLLQICFHSQMLANFSCYSFSGYHRIWMYDVQNLPQSYLKLLIY